MMNDVTLYAVAMDPRSQAVKCYLLYKGVEHRTVFVHPRRLRQQLPLGDSVPVLSIGRDFRDWAGDPGLWLDRVFPQRELVAATARDSVLEQDRWLRETLLPLVLREAAGSDDALPLRLRKRLRQSRALAQTVEGGVSAGFRALHLLWPGAAPVRGDDSGALDERRSELAEQFIRRLEDGPFLGGRDKPGLADVSAYPLIVTPRLARGEPLFLPGDGVAAWVAALEGAVPELQHFLPHVLRYRESVG